jgi:hypothetical protein
MRQKSMVVLTKRDLDILLFTFEQRAVSCKQLAKKFFPNSSFQAAHMRLEKLSREKYLVKSYTLWRNTRTVVYGTTDKGINAFVKDYHFIIGKYDYKSDSVNHDLGLILVRERLEKLTMVKQYLSESMLQNCSELSEDPEFRDFTLANSDAALTIETQTGQFKMAVEYEISSKQVARYIRKISEYYYSPDIEVVIYICGNASIEKLIHKADTEVREKKSSKVFTCLEENFHKSVESVSFNSNDNYTIKLS